MKKTILKTLTNLSAILLLTLTVHAQSNFSGNWKRNDQETDAIANGLSLNLVPTNLVITQDAQTITIKRTAVNGQGTSTYSETIKFDGSKAEMTTPSNNKKSSTVTWSADKNQLTQQSTYKDKDGATTQSSKLIFQLTEGGKVLKIIADLDYGGGNAFLIQEYFDKQ
jgi:hypothetical protein